MDHNVHHGKLVNMIVKSWNLHNLLTVINVKLLFSICESSTTADNLQRLQQAADFLSDSLQLAQIQCRLVM